MPAMLLRCWIFAGMARSYDLVHVDHPSTNTPSSSTAPPATLAAYQRN